MLLLSWSAKTEDILLLAVAKSVTQFTWTPYNMDYRFEEVSLIQNYKMPALLYTQTIRQVLPHSVMRKHSIQNDSVVDS